jgi:hypothetical protein
LVFRPINYYFCFANLILFFLIRAFKFCTLQKTKRRRGGRGNKKGGGVGNSTTKGGGAGNNKKGGEAGNSTTKGGGAGNSTTKGGGADNNTKRNDPIVRRHSA